MSADCSRCHSPTESGDLRCAVCALPLPVAAELVDGLRSQVMRCDDCGAALAYDVEKQAPHCGFCGSVMHLEESDDPIEEAEFFLPFAVGQEEAERTIKAWQNNQGFFKVQDLASKATLHEVSKIYWVGWLSSVSGFGTWAADSNVGSGRSAWAPHSGAFDFDVDRIVVSASRGLRLKESSVLASSYRLDSSRPFSEIGDASIAIERFDVRRSRARTLVRDAMHSHALRLASSCVPGTRQRNLSVSVVPKKLATKRYAFPAYIVAYRHQEKLYRVVVSGQDADVIVGEAPTSMARVVMAFFGFFFIFVPLLWLLLSFLSRL